SAIKILANRATVRAVQHVGLGRMQAAFYAAGSVRISEDLTLSVDRPITLIIKQVGSDLVITAADPRQTANPVTITVTRPLTGPGVKLLPDGRSSQITFALPAAPYHGSSVTQTFHALAILSNLAEGESALQSGVNTA